jgi:hypothetical protein
MRLRFQFSLQTLLALTTFVALAAALLSWHLPWISYANFVANLAKKIVIDGTLKGLLALGVAATASGALMRAITLASRDR